MAKKRKYYVVWQGARPGIYDSWESCQKQIKGFPGARYKSYKSEKEATEALIDGPSKSQSQKASSIPKGDNHYHRYLKDIDTPSISVDAASSGNPGIVEYQGVDTETKRLLFRQGPFDKGTNNLGEFLALVHALAYLHKKGNKTMTVYSDSRTAMSWFKKQKVKTSFFDKYKNPELKDLVERALDWIKKNHVPNPIKKWDTKKWGEIPADFGRK